MLDAKPHDLRQLSSDWCSDVVLDYADLFSVILPADNLQEFETRWDEVLFSMSKIPLDDFLESLYKLRIRESDQPRKTSWNCATWRLSGDIGSKLSGVENHGEEAYRSETTFTKL